MSIENPNYHLLYEKIIKKGWGLDSVHNFRVYGYCLLLAESGVRFLIRQFLFVFCCTPSRLGTSAPSPRTPALRRGWVRRHLALGLGRLNRRVDTTSSSQLRRHSGWSLALGRRYRSALELETSPRAASLLPLGLLPWYS